MLLAERIFPATLFYRLLIEISKCKDFIFVVYTQKDIVESLINTPDTFFNGSRLSELAFRGLSYFFKVSSTPDIELKILTRTG
jgi:hypothetical protein